MSVAEQRRLARWPITPRHPLNMVTFCEWVDVASPLVAADPDVAWMTSAGHYTGDVRVSVSIALRKSDAAWVMDGRPRFADANALAAAVIAKMANIARIIREDLGQ
jgi:hypothetical protein